MLVENRSANRVPYSSSLRAIMSIAKAQESRQWLSHWPELTREATPLIALPGLARTLGVARIDIKDESKRASLCSFKALGAPIALIRLIQRMWPEQKFEARELFLGKHAAHLRDFTVISATDGNHGKGLAAAARSIGCRCVIVLHANVRAEREEAIAAFGAEIVRVQGNYDESVTAAAQLAKANGWHVVSDTSYDGYEEIPRDVMQGYGTIAAEIVEALHMRAASSAPITHVFLQGGVGGLAAGIASYLWEVCEDTRPAVVLVEPQQADCLYQSAVQGTAARATGSVDSVMAGLACGKASPLAWRFLESGADFFMTVEDEDAVQAMQVLAQGSTTDPPIVSGESGAAGLAGLVRLMQDPDLSHQAGLNRGSSVLLINTEGATAPAAYRELVGESAEAVLARQRAFLDRGAGGHA